MIKTMTVLNKLKRISSTNSKIEYLRENRNVEKDLAIVLRCVYSPYVIFGISDKKYAQAFDEMITGKTFNIPKQYQKLSLIELLKYLKQHNTGSAKDLEVLSFYLKKIPNNPLVYDFVKEVITKKLRIGMDATNINKAFEQTIIPEFKVQLAKKYEPQKINGQAFTITEKIDGQRCYAVKKNGVMKFYARTGREITRMVEIEKEFYKHRGDIVFDGELIYNGKEELTTNERYKKTMSILSSNEQKQNIKFRVFDCIDLASFEKLVQYNMSYENRYIILKSKIETFKMDTDVIQLLPQMYTGTDMQQIDECLTQITDNGGEGIMININSAPYEFKRTYNLMKVKPVNDCDLKIIGYKEGDGKYTGKLGAFVCEYKNNTVDVGSGLNDRQRTRFWAIREKLIGKLIKVEYFEETCTNDQYSLRFPRFKELRKDKVLPSYD